MALDLDLAIATRARAEQQAQLDEIFEKADDEAGLGPFCDALLRVLRT